MEVIPGIDAIPADMPASVISIGMFDGVHRGHRRIIEIALEKARDMGWPCVAVTFDRHPLEITQPGAHPLQLTTVAQKLRLLEEIDVDIVLLIHFDATVAEIPAAEFAETILGEKLRARFVVIGENFRFGRRAEGGVEFLQARSASTGMEAISVPLLRDDGDVISSTCIRKLLEKGEIEKANAMLGWEYLVEGVIVHGDNRGATLGFPTANLEVHVSRAIPADGVYAGEIHMEQASHWGVVYIGRVPTFKEGVERRIEIHIPGFQGDLYGHFLNVSFKQRLRGDIAFKDKDALVEQITRDVARARELFLEP